LTLIFGTSQFEYEDTKISVNQREDRIKVQKEYHQ
jgi:hypothetical protein